MFEAEEIIDDHHIKNSKQWLTDRGVKWIYDISDEKPKPSLFITIDREIPKSEKDIVEVMANFYNKFSKVEFKIGEV